MSECVTLMDDPDYLFEFHLVHNIIFNIFKR